MFKILFCICVVSSIFMLAWGVGDIGPGLWYVINIQSCPHNDQLEYKFNVSRHKMSRHEEAYNAHMQLGKDLGKNIGVTVTICKHVDGGCKTTQVMGDDSLQKFLYDYAEENTISFLMNAGLDPPEFPVPAGDYQVIDFKMDMCLLPKDGMEGVFGVDARLIRDNIEVGCMECTVEFRKKDDIENYDCE